jgi:hypothetical protein
VGASTSRNPLGIHGVLTEVALLLFFTDRREPNFRVQIHVHARLLVCLNAWKFLGNRCCNCSDCYIVYSLADADVSAERYVFISKVEMCKSVRKYNLVNMSCCSGNFDRFY